MKKSMKQSTLTMILSGLSIVLLAVILYMTLQLDELTNDIHHSNKERFDLTYNANRFMRGSDSLTNEVRAFAVTGDSKHYDNYWNEVNTLKNTDIGVANLRDIGITEEEEAKIAEMKFLSDNLIPLESAAMDLMMAGDQAGAIEAVYGASYNETIAKIGAANEAFLTMLDARAAAHVDELIGQANSKQALSYIFLIVLVLLQLISAVYFRAGVISPIIKICKAMRELAVGHLHEPLALKCNSSEIGQLTCAIHETRKELILYVDDLADKLGALAQGQLDLAVDIEYIGDFAPIKTSLTTIITSLRDTMSQINSASTLVSSGSLQISEGAQALARGTVEQSATIESLSTTMGEIEQTTRGNAEMAMKAAQLSETIKVNAQKSSEQMDQMTQAVREINEASQSIHKVIKVIDDIAFQTNILALNAAVEAARAGQNGKGFAVVAEEVRNLASKSAAAAKDTGVLIENSIEKAELGADIAHNTAASLAEIVSGIHESFEVINDIANSSKEQSNAITGVHQGITQVSQVVQQNSATAEESAAASEEMSAQASLMAELVTRFRLGQHDPVSLPAAPRFIEMPRAAGAEDWNALPEPGAFGGKY